MKGSISVDLGHPFFVYAFCVAAGVRAALTRGKILNFKQSDREEKDPSEPNSSKGEMSSSSKKSVRTPKSLSDEVTDLSGKMMKVTQFCEELLD
ncbi:hypothetical protein IEQ34_003477 [Dendrobium chrysotoxum]|uniref:Uncharacterized protein n=1 Tax=Dendrobium chrysotoxum TaxID=161865 RepID=A0AAV7HJR4_DENCH|nr:hypothetical protein IEQ34_003477 [Dendrobium chrysotoxum]